MKNNILITGKNGFIGRAIEGGKAFDGDILDFTDLCLQSHGIEGIVHLAAKSNAKICEDSPRLCIESNLLGLMNVLEIARDRKIWVLFASTFQVEETSLYGLTKLAGEEICRIYSKLGVRIKIIRLPIVYGPGDRSFKVVTRIIHALRCNKVPLIVTSKKFNFVYVEDMAKIIEKEVDVLQGGYGRKYTLHSLVAGIKKCLKKGG